MKLNYLLPAIKSTMGGCSNCGNTEDILPLETTLYQGFGGWTITKNGKCHYQGDGITEFEDERTLQSIEDEAILDPENDWRAVVNLPLRSATYQRHRDGEWVLVESSMGFA